MVKTNGIFVFCAALLWLELASSKPLLKEISLKRSFDFVLKPIPLKPLTFFKEKWSPFGKFGVKHGIAKRSALEDENERVLNLDDAVRHDDLDTSPYEVYEHLDAPPPGFIPHQGPLPINLSGSIPSSGIQTQTILHGLPPPQERQLAEVQNNVPLRSVEQNIPISPILTQNNAAPIAQQNVPLFAPYNIPPTENHNIPPTVHHNIIHGNVQPVPAPVINNVQPQPNLIQPQQHLLTDVSHFVPGIAYQSVASPVAATVENVQPAVSNSLVEEELPNEVPPEEADGTANTILKGSRLAVSVGSYILEILSKFLSNRQSNGGFLSGLSGSA